MIPVNEPVVGAREMEYVDECLKTVWISSAGRFINEFETSWPSIVASNMASPSATARPPFKSRCEL